MKSNLHAFCEVVAHFLYTSKEFGSNASSEKITLLFLEDVMNWFDK